MKVTFSPFVKLSASSYSIMIILSNANILLPNDSFLAWYGTDVCYKFPSKFNNFTLTNFSLVIADNRGIIGSICFLLMAHILSHSCNVVFLLWPCANINSISASGVIPRLSIPCIVGNRGSSQPSTYLFSTNQASFLLLNTVLTKFNLEKSWIVHGVNLVLVWIYFYWGFLSAYSFVLNVCVTPSMLSVIGHAKSYVG